jgi:transcriptional regulator with XRE-family HTH domain
LAEPRSPRHLAFGEALRECRTEFGLSQEALAHVAGLDRTYVSGIECGERNPSLTNLFKLADALGGAALSTSLAGRDEGLKIAPADLLKDVR